MFSIQVEQWEPRISLERQLEKFGCGSQPTFEGHDQRRSVGSTLLSDKELSLGSTSLNYVSQKLKKRDHTPSIKDFTGSLHVVSHAEQVFVVGVIQPDNTIMVELDGQLSLRNDGISQCGYMIRIRSLVSLVRFALGKKSAMIDRRHSLDQELAFCLNQPNSLSKTYSQEALSNKPSF